MLFAFLEMDEFEAQDFANACVLLPQERLDKISRYKYEKDKKLCAVAYLLLLYGLYELYGESYRGLLFGYNRHNKPVLKDLPQINFNLSHCDMGAVCAFSEKPVGVDIQDFTTPGQGLLQATMSEREGAIIKTSNRPYEEFTRFWAIKESYLKCLGSGLTDRLTHLDFSQCREDHFQRYGYYFYVEKKGNAYISECLSMPSKKMAKVIYIQAVREFIESYMQKKKNWKQDL